MLKLLLQDGLESARQSLISRIRRNPYHYLVVLLCLVNITLVVVNTGMWIMAAYQRLFVAADFTSFYTGFYMVRVGEGANLYDPAFQSSFQQKFMGGLVFEGGVLLFPNPPHVAITFSPISLLPLDAAFYLWTVIQVGLLIWILFSLNRLFSYWEKRERIILIITILAFWPLTYSFLLGQFSLFLLLGLLQMYISMRNSKLPQAGLWVFLLSIKPHMLMIPGMLTVNKRFWQVALVAVATFVFFFIASTLIIGFQPWLGYIQSLRSLGSYFGEYGVHPNTEYTVRGVLSNVLGNAQGNLTNIFSIVLLLLGMIFTWLLWRRGVRQGSPRFILYFAFTVLLSVFLSLHLNPHDSLVLVLPAALFYDYLRQGSFPRKTISILLLICPLVFLFTGFSDFNILGVIRPPVVLIVGLMAWVSKYMLMDFRSQENRENTIVEPANPT